MPLSSETFWIGGAAEKTKPLQRHQKDRADYATFSVEAKKFKNFGFHYQSFSLVNERNGP